MLYILQRYTLKDPDYIIPIPPAPPAGIAGTSSLIVDTTDSVVRSVDATLVAFCNALLVTLAGSTIPALTCQHTLLSMR